MRLSSLLKVSALIVTATLISVPMAEAGREGGQAMENSKDTVTVLAEGVVEEGVDAGKPIDKKPSEKPRKPKMEMAGARQKWPEFVGMDADEVVEMIREARPDLKRVVKVTEGSMVTMDMRRDRVRVFYDGRNKVTRPPRVG